MFEIIPCYDGRCTGVMTYKVITYNNAIESIWYVGSLEDCNKYIEIYMASISAGIKLPTGWICPRCNKVHSPYSLLCDCKPDHQNDAIYKVSKTTDGV